jgi:hypothetical protein
MGTFPLPETRGSPDVTTVCAPLARAFEENFGLEEMPHVAPDLEEMEQKLIQVRGLETRQEELRGQAREITAQLKKLASEGEKVRSRLRSHLQAKFGPTSETLVKFGFRPRRIPRRVRVIEKPASETPPSTTPQTETPEPQTPK